MHHVVPECMAITDSQLRKVWFLSFSVLGDPAGFVLLDGRHAISRQDRAHFFTQRDSKLSKADRIRNAYDR